MCVVCKDWEKGKITSEEALRNLGELMISVDEYSEENVHYLDVSEKILSKEVPFEETDEELDKNWHEETYDD